MARISGVEPRQAGPLTRFTFWMTKRKLGRLIEPVTIAAHSTRILRGTVQMEVAQAAVHSLDTSLKELAAVKAAMLIGCPF